MIRIGTLCWLVNMPNKLAQFNGRVVEVAGRFEFRRFSAEQVYLVTAPWLCTLAQNLGTDNKFAVSAIHLQPFSDPDNVAVEHTATAVPAKSNGNT